MKMSLGKKVANALSFAHLAKIGSSAKAESEDDKKKDDDGERDHEDGDVKKSKKAKSEDKHEDEYAEDDDMDEEASGDDRPDSDDGDDDDDADKKSKKAKKAEDDDDKDEEMRGNSAAAVARRREQARCAAIFGSPSASRNPVLAANLAFKTRMSRKEALAVLDATPAAAQNNLSRSARNPNVGSGSASSMNSQQAITSSWDHAFAKVSGRR